MSPEERDKLRKPDACPPEEIQPVLPMLPQRAEEKCDPPEEPIEEVFVEPSAVPSPPPILQPILPQLIIGNAEKTSSCPDGRGAPYGDTITTAAGTITENVSLLDIEPPLTNFQKQFIAGLGDISSWITKTANQLEQLGRLQPSQASKLYQAIQDAKNSADAEAQLVADGLLRCHWENVQKVAYCPAGAISSPATHPSRGNPVTVPAHAFSSDASQDDADFQAQAAADALLDCSWVNEFVTVACDPAIAGVKNATPSDINDGLPLGTVNIAAGLFSSSVSQDDANQRAAEFAQTLLNCFWVNVEKTRTCYDIGIGTFEGECEGDPVTIAAGAISSFTSQQDADDQAVSMAEAALICACLSDEVTVTCPDQVVETLDGPVHYPADPNASSPYQYTLPTGSVSSSISKEDANNIAQLMALSNLVCRYCNQQVDARCTGDGEPDPISAGDVEDDWSRDVTLGVPAGTYCSDDAASAQSIADSLGGIPYRSYSGAQGDLCTWGNNPKKARCVQTEDTDVLFLFPSNHPGANKLSPNSTPKPSEVNSFVHVPKDTIILTKAAIAELDPVAAATPEGSQAFVDQQAETLVLSMLSCFWENQELTLKCSANVADVDGVQTTYGQPVLSDGSAASGTTSVTVPAQMFQSYSSIIEADKLAAIYGISMLDCWVVNDITTGTCNGESPNRGYVIASYNSQYPTIDTVPLGSSIPIQGISPFYPRFFNTSGSQSEFVLGSDPVLVSIGIGVVISKISKADANSQAETLAQAYTDCSYGNDAALSVWCSSGLKLDELGIVPKNTVQSRTRSEANQLAANLARGQMKCSDYFAGSPGEFGVVISPNGAGLGVTPGHIGSCNCASDQDPADLQGAGALQTAELSLAALDGGNFTSTRVGYVCLKVKISGSSSQAQLSDIVTDNVTIVTGVQEGEQFDGGYSTPYSAWCCTSHVQTSLQFPIAKVSVKESTPSSQIGDLFGIHDSSFVNQAYVVTQLYSGPFNLNVSKNKSNISRVTVEEVLHSCGNADIPARPFELRVVKNEFGDDKIRVFASTIVGFSPTDLGFSQTDNPPYLLDPSPGTVVIGLTISDSQYGFPEITSQWIEIKNSVPNNAGNTHYVRLGYINAYGQSWRVSNYCYGPISMLACRNWFASSPPYWYLTFLT